MSQDLENSRVDEHGFSTSNQELKFDRYDIIGLLLLMFGWWRLISGAWLIALGCIVVGWLLAFAEGTTRDSLVRIIGGVSSDVLALLKTGFQKVQGYIAQKHRSGSSDVGK